MSTLLSGPLLGVVVGIKFHANQSGSSLER